MCAPKCTADAHFHDLLADQLQDLLSKNVDTLHLCAHPLSHSLCARKGAPGEMSKIFSRIFLATASTLSFAMCGTCTSTPPTIIFLMCGTRTRTGSSSSLTHLRKAPVFRLSSSFLSFDRSSIHFQSCASSSTTRFLCSSLHCVPLPVQPLALLIESVVTLPRHGHTKGRKLPTTNS